MVAYKSLPGAGVLTRRGSRTPKHPESAGERSATMMTFAGHPCFMETGRDYSKMGGSRERPA